MAIVICHVMRCTISIHVLQSNCVEVVNILFPMFLFYCLAKAKKERDLHHSALVETNVLFILDRYDLYTGQVAMVSVLLSVIMSYLYLGAIHTVIFFM